MANIRIYSLRQGTYILGKVRYSMFTQRPDHYTCQVSVYLPKTWYFDFQILKY